MRTTLRIALLLPALLLSACDNVGRAFDPGSGGGGEENPQDDRTNIVAVPVGGDAPDGKPLVKSVYPKGSGWPGTVPIVVVFNKSISQESIGAGGGGGSTTTLYVRIKGNTNRIAASYDFLFGSTVVVIRPVVALVGSISTPGTGTGGAGGTTTKQAYEVVIEPDLRDIDAVKFGGAAAQVLAEFTPDQDTTKIVDGQILTILPEDAKRDVPREQTVFAIFTKPATASSVKDTTFVVRERGGDDVIGKREFPINSGTSGDGRILRFTPTAALPAGTDIDIEAYSGITFGTTGKLDIHGKLPYSRFSTLPMSQPSAVRVGNALTGFPDKVNAGNLESLQIDTTLDATAGTNDSVVVRIYGLDTKTKNTTDINFVQRTARVNADGAQTVTVDFTQALGTVPAPRFAEGSLTLAAELLRGSSRRTGFIHASSANKPTLDVTAPTLTSVGPPAGTVGNEIRTDLEQLAFSGKASEKLAEATLVAGSQTASLFASNSDGRFLVHPLALGRRTAPLDYSLTIRDAAGNFAAAAVNGQIVPRGAVTGSVSGGTLVVEAYDEATLEVIEGVLVLVEPGLPQKPAAGRVSTSTGANGRATFTGLAQPTHSITLIATGYDLKTLLDTPAGIVSLPLRPLTRATATLSGTASYLTTPNTAVLVGSNVLDGAISEAIRTTTAAPSTIPATPIRPNRMQALFAFSGTLEPSSVATYNFYACQLCGSDGITPTAPSAPVAGGAATSAALTLFAAGGTTRNLLSTYGVDFSTTGGLGTISGTPTVRIVTSLKGFSGMTLFGIGFVTGAGGSDTVNGTYSLASAIALAPFSPAVWVSTEAKDSSGNLSRHRRLVLDNTVGTTFGTGDPLGIPDIATPGGPSTGSPAITYTDRLDSSLLIGGVGFLELTATDSVGRAWTVLRQDVDSLVGTVSLQLPELTGHAGLATGDWSVRAESHLIFAVDYTNGDFMVEEIRRQQVKYARAAAKTFVVN